jgi:hypothetical protein
MVMIFVTCETKEAELFWYLKLPQQGKKLDMGLVDKKRNGDSRNKMLRGWLVLSVCLLERIIKLVKTTHEFKKAR